MSWWWKNNENNGFALDNGVIRVEDLRTLIKNARAKNKTIIKRFQESPTDMVLPEFLKPDNMIRIYMYSDLEELLNRYESSFNTKLDMCGINMSLEGWKELLDYCILMNKQVEQITNVDIFKIRHPNNLLDGEKYYSMASYQRPWVIRKIVPFLRGKRV